MHMYIHKYILTYGQNKLVLDYAERMDSKTGTYMNMALDAQIFHKRWEMNSITSLILCDFLEIPFSYSFLQFGL